MERIGYSEQQFEGRLRLKEHNDCTVMAWSSCFDSSYEAARSWLEKFGRKHRKGMYLPQIDAALKACKKAKTKVGPYTRQNTICISHFIKKHPKGRYYCLVRGHALCIKDGIVYDYCGKPRRQINYAARVYLEGEI